MKVIVLIVNLKLADIDRPAEFFNCNTQLVSSVSAAFPLVVIEHVFC